MKPTCRAVTIFLIGLILAPRASAADLSLGEALAAAETYSPRLDAGRLLEQAAHEGVRAAQSYYYPSIAADAVDSWGFPGSSGYLGLGGPMGSPFRSGPAAGLTARQTLYDFGRTSSGVRGARYVERERREQSEAERYALDQDVLRTFYECARFRSEREAWDSLHDELELVAREVSRFVDTGQRSIVDRYLADAQVEEARTNRSFFKSRMGSTLSRLGLLMGAPAVNFACPALPPLNESVPLYPDGSTNPYLLQARTRIESAENRLSAAKDDYLPLVLGVAGVGAMDKSRLVDRKDYSAGLAVILPVFDGLGTTHRVAEARREVGAGNRLLEDARLKIAELNAGYDELIDASKARLEHLEHERTLAREGYKVAKSRYSRFQGTLVDLRDALRNLGRIETDMADTQANLLEAMGGKLLLNGSSPTRRAEPRQEKP